jgi:outer membrane protein TolC
VDILDRSLRVTSGRERAGLTTPLDTARISALRDQRKADIPVLVAQRQASLFRLALLTGRTPTELPAVAGARTAPPRILQPIPIGDGASLLARRPDVRASERRLAAATANIGVATADLYPKISLGGSIGSTSFGFGDAFGASALRWLAGPLISWSFPNQARIRARIGVARADSQAALASFDGSVLQALSETETALSNYARALDRRIALASARDQAERAVRIVRRSSAKGRSIIFPSWTRNARSPTRRPNWQTATRGSRMRRLIFSGRWVVVGSKSRPKRKCSGWLVALSPHLGLDHFVAAREGNSFMIWEKVCHRGWVWAAMQS